MLRSATARPPLPGDAATTVAAAAAAAVRRRSVGARCRWWPASAERPAAAAARPVPACRACRLHPPAPSKAGRAGVDAESERRWACPPGRWYPVRRHRRCAHAGLGPGWPGPVDPAAGHSSGCAGRQACAPAVARSRKSPLPPVRAQLDIAPPHAGSTSVSAPAHQIGVPSTPRTPLVPFAPALAAVEVAHPGLPGPGGRHSRPRRSRSVSLLVLGAAPPVVSVRTCDRRRPVEPDRDPSGHLGRDARHRHVETVDVDGPRRGVEHQRDLARRTPRPGGVARFAVMRRRRPSVQPFAAPLAAAGVDCHTLGRRR